MEKSGRQAVGQEQACLLLGFQSKTLAELEDIFTETAEAQELASGIGDAAEARQWLRTKLQGVGEKAGFAGVLGEALGRVGPTFPIACPGSRGEQSSLACWFCSTVIQGATFLNVLFHHPLGHCSCTQGQGWAAIMW